MNLKDLLTLIGGTLGALTFLWKLWDALLSYLRLSLDIRGAQDNARSTALVAVDNQGFIAKKVHYAALLIGPESSDVLDIARTILTELGTDPSAKESKVMRALFDNRPREAVFSKDRRCGLIPIPFLFREQARIGNETVRHRLTIRNAEFGGSSWYAVRFLVYIQYPLGVVRWRSTSDLLWIP